MSRDDRPYFHSGLGIPLERVAVRRWLTRRRPLTYDRRMPKPTFSATTLINIWLAGVPRPLGQLPDDQGMVEKLAEAIQRRAVPAPVAVTACGGGVYLGLWTSEDAPRVVGFLKSIGADEARAGS